MYSSSDLKLLTIAALHIYKMALSDAASGLRLNWWLPLFHLSYLAIFFVVALLASFMGILGGFLLGLSTAAIFASYLSTVESGVRQERFLIGETWREMAPLFLPVISVGFTFFILEFVASRAFPGVEQLWLLGLLNAILVLLFSPAPEVIYNRRGHALDTFSECLEFVRENILEWYFPWLLLGGVLFAYDFNFFRFAVWTLLSTPPLEFIWDLLTMSSDIIESPIGGGMLTVVLLYVTFFVFLFRGSLYKQLSQSSRRKRIYQARMT